MRKIPLEKRHKELLFKIPLFRDLPLNIRQSILDTLDCSAYEVRKKDIVACQNTPCRKLYILLKGKLCVDIVDGLGNKVMIEHIIAPRTFATPHLFSANNILPATFTAIENSVLLTADKESAFKLISRNPPLLHGFFRAMGNCNACTVSRLKVLSRKTVRERFVVYLFENRVTRSQTVTIIHSRSELAEYLNVTRPALSKEINRMAKEGIILIAGKQIEILNEMALKKYL